MMMRIGPLVSSVDISPHIPGMLVDGSFSMVMVCHWGSRGTYAESADRVELI
jgi:hypothetical protein